MQNQPPEANRRRFLKTGVATLALASAARPADHDQPDFELGELGIAQLQGGLQSGRFTSRSLAEKFLTRIEAVDRQGPALRAVIEINPDALQIADALD